MAAIPPLSHPKYPLPIDVRLKLPDPTTPWKIGDRIMDEMSAQASSSYRKVEVLPEDPEWNFIHAMFHHDKPIRWDMIGAYCIHEPHQTRSFELNLVTQDREADKFTPTWHSEPRAEQRARVIDRWRKTTEPFSPFQTMESGGRSEPLRSVRVLPMWHGSSYEVCASVAETGFTFFGKKSIGQKSAGDPKSTDEGFFGSGIYFTNSARYAADIYSTGHLVLAWVSAREPFPVVGDPKQTDMQTLQGRGAYKHYNAHYIPVCPQEMSALCAMYFPCTEGQTPVCDEVVVFQKAQTLPRFWVVLEPSALHLMQPKFIKPQSGPALATALDKPFKTLRENQPDYFSSSVELIEWSLDGKRVFVNDTRKKTIDIWDAISGKLLLSRSCNVPKGLWSYELRPFWSPDRTCFSSGVKDRKVGWLASIREFFDKELTGFAHDHDHNYEFNVGIFSADTCERLTTLKGHTGDIRDLVWSSDGQRILTGSADKTVRVWDAEKSELLKVLRGHKGTVLSVAWSTDGKSVLSGSADKTVRVWDAEKGKLLKILEGHEDEVWCVRWSPNEDMLLSVSSDATLRVWDAVTGRSFHTLEYPKYVRSNVSWVPDSSYFFVPGGLSHRCYARICDAPSGALLQTFDGGAHPAVLSPDGKYVAARRINHPSDTKDYFYGRLGVWSVADGKLHLDLKAEGNKIWLASIKWSPDSKYILTGNTNGAIRIWKVP